MNNKMDELFQDYYDMKANEKDLYETDFTVNEIIKIEEMYSAKGTTLSKVTDDVIDDFEAFHKEYYIGNIDETNGNAYKMIL